MPLQLWLAFVAASAVLLIIPGPTILTVISYSVAHGRAPTCRWSRPSRSAIRRRWSSRCSGLGALLATSAFWFTADQVGRRPVPALPRHQAAARRHLAGRAGGAAPRRLALEAVRQHLSRDRAQSQGHRLLRRLPAAVHRSARGSVTPAAVGAGPDLRLHGRAQRHAVCGVRRLGARLLASPRAQRRFNLAGGSLLSAAGIWALLARRPA